MQYEHATFVPKKQYHSHVRCQLTILDEPTQMLQVVLTSHTETYQHTNNYTDGNTVTMCCLCVFITFAALMLLVWSWEQH